MGLECGTNYGCYNYALRQPQISGGDKVGHAAEKAWNATATATGMAGVGAIGLAGACVANTINSQATTFKGTFAETFPGITKSLKGAYKWSGAQLFTEKVSTFAKGNKTIAKAKGFVSNNAAKLKTWSLDKAKLTGIVNYFKKDGSIGNTVAKSINGLKDTLTTGYKNMSGKGKLIAGIGLATLTAAGLIFGAGKYNAGKIDQKYEDRAKFV